MERRWRAGAAAAGLVAVWILISWVLPVSELIAGRISQILLSGVSGLVTVVWGWAAIRARGRIRIGLALWSLASLGWSMGEAIWLTDGWHSGGVGVPISATANIGFGITMISTPVAVGLLVGRPSASLRTLFDALLIGTSLFFVAWALLIGPRFRAGDAQTGTTIYALADVVILSLVILLLADTGPALRTPLEIAAVGVVLNFAADTTYAYQAVAGTYRFGALPDLFWLIAFLTISVGAPRRSELLGVTRLSVVNRPRTYLPYVPFLLAFGTGVTLLITGEEIDRVLSGLSLLLTGLVVLRQLLVLNDNLTLVEELRFRAEHDPLTGLANRARFEECAERALAPHGGAGRVGMLLIDLDGFKPVNDVYGHDSGDRVLVEVGRRLVAAAGPDDVVARIGGDEFAVLTTGDPGALAERFRSGIHAPVELPAAAVRIGASIGVADCLPGERGVGQLQRDADAAMYEAKRATKAAAAA
ncbi:GGDEF domain-containing protein [Actinoplanes sp. NPDC051851]|uniref:GGDEF domain-containing protein n=1 Tax=Actinoplanes sp. NPDC051851 TaxID=3154753 RepID=UPI00342A181B